jgi:Nucleotidyltransferase of unknown function (DUF6036)
MTAEEIRTYLTELNEELRLMDIKGEVSLYGGAVMCLAFKSRPATKDVDAIFEPVKAIRTAANRVAERHGLNIDWLNLAVKMFVVEHERQVLMDLSHLKVLVPHGDYLLAMKVLAFRQETSDIEDVEFLIEHLHLKSADEVIRIVAAYYPKKAVKLETVFRLEELF